MHDLTSFQRDLLYIVAGLDNPHGLAIKAEYEKEVYHGGIYQNLDALVEEGFLEKSAKDYRTNVYRLTQCGHREIKTRRDWEQKYLEQDVPIV
jgi:PadR family transcriptional regulator, regulatory protein PadR